MRNSTSPHRFSPRRSRSGRPPDKIRPSDRRDRIDSPTAARHHRCEDAGFRDGLLPALQARRARGLDGWRLIVAIADVSHYVKPGEPIDDDAYERATSVYFPRRVIPMLPEKLSNGLCSLNPNEDRLAMVCDMLITRTGEIHAYQFFPAVICSHARFTYNEVAAILSNTRGPEAALRSDMMPHRLSFTRFTALSRRRQAMCGRLRETETQTSARHGRIERSAATPPKRTS